MVRRPKQKRKSVKQLEQEKQIASLEAQATQYRLQRDSVERLNNKLHDRLREKNRILNSAYDAASKDRIYGDWMTSNLSPNDDLERELETLVERAEDLYRNNPVAASAVKGRVKNVVGCGYTPQARLDNDEANAAIEEVWRRWSRAEMITAKMRLAERCMGIYNEAFILWSDVKRADRSIPSLHIQVISPKRIETPPGKIGDKNVRMGVELDPKTKEPVAYYVRRGTPGDSLDWELNYDRIPAARMFHQFEPDFPGQTRPAPWLSPTANVLKDWEDLREAHLISEQVRACHSAFVTTAGDKHNAADASLSVDYSAQERQEEISAGRIEYLKPGEGVAFMNPGAPSATLHEYLRDLIRIVAAAIEYPYELLAKHWDNSFSGGQLSLIDGHQTFKNWQQQAVEYLWSRVWVEFIDRLAIMGVLPVPMATYAREPWVYQRHKWTMPGMPWMDPVKDAKANQMALDAELTTRTRVLNELGIDFDDFEAERLREKKREAETEAAIQEYRESLGLIPDPDNPPVETDNVNDMEEADAQAA